MTISKAKPPEQPRRAVLRRWREHGTTWAELECGHEEPINGREIYSEIRCQQCNPCPRTTFEPIEGWD